MSFTLDPRLEADTLPVCTLDLCEVRLHRNASWLWLILVPLRENMADLTDLSLPDQLVALNEINRVAVALKSIAAPYKLNIAAIGNVVRQLHIHVIARHEGDAAWPAPVWGQPHKAEYPLEKLEELVTKLRAAL